VDLLYERLLPAELGDGGASARGVRLSASALEKGLLGGVGTMGSYGLALWAMTQAPLAVVAALRETSILFGALIAFILLKEKVAGLRIAAALGIAGGAILLRLA
jgi:drug/metabolite transporter (DMT)-like permease